MNARTGPYRRIRIATERTDAPLPALIDEPFERLVAQERQVWETQQAPRWWQAHVEAHEAPRAYWRAEDIRPKPLRLLYSVAWTTYLIFGSVAIVVLAKRSAGGHLPLYALYVTSFLISITRVTRYLEKKCTDALDERGMRLSVAEGFSFRRSLRYALALPLSLYLCAKEVLAWILWRRAGRTWTAESWDEGRVDTKIFARFQKEVVDGHKAAHLHMQVATGNDRRASEELATLAERERKRFEEHRVSQATLSKHHEHAYRHALARADQLSRRARALEDLSVETGHHLEALGALTDQYRALQENRRELQMKGALPADDMTDLELRSQMRTTHLALLEQRARAETLLRPTPTATAEDADEPAAQETPLKATGPHS